MFVSELLFKLKQAYLEHGDLSVRIDDDRESELLDILYLPEDEKLEERFLLLGLDDRPLLDFGD